MDKVKINNAVVFGSYDEVDQLPLSKIVKNDASGEKLSGIIIKGYETKFKSTKNENGEVFEPDCLNDFIERYFVKNKLNMVVDVLHNGLDVCGRVLTIEVNTMGFYFVVYIPKAYKGYEYMRDFYLKEGILQGFSKIGWATDYEIKYNSAGNYDYMLVKEMEILKISLVDNPANGVAFQKVAEIKNATQFVNSIEKKEAKSEIQNSNSNFYAK